MLVWYSSTERLSPASKDLYKVASGKRIAKKPRDLNKEV